MPSKLNTSTSVHVLTAKSKQLKVAISSMALSLIISNFSYANATSSLEGSHPDYTTYNFVSQEINDPFEPVNRYIYDFNQGIDFLILQPVSDIYKTITPAYKHERIKDLLSFLSEPITLVNNILQGDFKSATRTFGRILSNATLGLGITDIAGEFGTKKRPQGLDDTLAHYCMASGPYLVLPILGPSSARDAFATIGDFFSKPTSYLNRSIVITEDTTRLITTRSDMDGELEELRQVSLDSYALVRSIYSQNAPKVNRKNCP